MYTISAGLANAMPNKGEKNLGYPPGKFMPFTSNSPNTGWSKMNVQY